MSYDVEMFVMVRVTINDPDVIERITGPGGDEWRASLYQLHTRDDVLEMLADNACRNSERHANRLDGWADLPEDAATMEVGESRLFGVIEDVAP